MAREENVEEMSEVDEDGENHETITCPLLPSLNQNPKEVEF
jgi:hypothetical protein